MLTPWGDFAVADAHVHFFSRKFFEILGSQAGKSAADVAALAGWDLPSENPAELARTWAAELDSHGVSRAALIASVPGDEASVETAMAECPGRFFGYDGTQSLARLQESLNFLRLAGNDQQQRKSHSERQVIKARLRSPIEI